MSHRIPIQDFYDILKCQYPQDKLGSDIYQLNKKKIKYIASKMLNTVKEFANTIKVDSVVEVNDTIKIGNTDCNISELPQIPIGEILFFLEKRRVDGIKDPFDYIIKLLKNLEIEKIIHIINKNPLYVKGCCHYHHNRYNDSGIYGFIELYIQQYIFFSLIMKDNNIEIQKKISGGSTYIIYKGDKFTKQDKLYEEIIKTRECKSYADYDYTYSHDFKFNHKEINDKLIKKFDNLIKTYNFNTDILCQNVEQDIKNELFNETYIKDYTKLSFKMIYYAYFIMSKLYNEKELDNKIYREIKNCLKYYFI